jgi:hypothetical protein
MPLLKKLRLGAVRNVSCCFLKNLELKLYGMFHLEKLGIEVVWNVSS